VGVDPKKSPGVNLGTSSRGESSRLPLTQSTRRRMSNCKVTSSQVDYKYICVHTFWLFNWMETLFKHITLQFYHLHLVVSYSYYSSNLQLNVYLVALYMRLLKNTKPRNNHAEQGGSSFWLGLWWTVYYLNSTRCRRLTGTVISACSVHSGVRSLSCSASYDCLKH